MEYAPTSSLTELARVSKYLRQVPMQTALPTTGADVTVSTETTQRALAAKGNKDDKTASGNSAMKKKRNMWLTRRSDAPAIRTTKKGSMASALAAGGPGKKEEAMANLINDVVAPSGKRPRISRWATWQRVRQNWMGTQPVLPLTPHTIAVVLAQLKEGGYRSVGDYISTAKGKRLEQYEWSSRLARARAIYVRSALRGIGPAKQCEEVPFDDMIKGAKAVADESNVPHRSVQHDCGPVLLRAARD